MEVGDRVKLRSLKDLYCEFGETMSPDYSRSFPPTVVVLVPNILVLSDIIRETEGVVINKRKSFGVEFVYVKFYNDILQTYWMYPQVLDELSEND